MWIQKNYQKRLVLQDTNEKGFDVSRCIICQHQSDTTVTSIENGRCQLIEVAAVWKDEVFTTWIMQYYQR